MQNKKRSPWAWIPSLYLAQGIPYVVVMTVSVIFYKRMGVSNTDIALYTSWLNLPWVIKPLWSPIVDLLKTKRWWIVVMQLLIGAGLAGVALTIPVPSFFQYTLIFFWLLAFSSATHDIAADGFYMLALSEHQQAYFVGIRSTFYRIAMLTGQGLLVILAGFLEVHTGLEPLQIKVSADPQIQKELFTPVVLKDDFDSKGTFSVTASEIVISSQKEEAEVIDSLKKWASVQNRVNGFTIAAVNELENNQSKESWYTKQISRPLTEKLKVFFNRSEKSDLSMTPGNVGLVGIKLSSLDDEDEVVLTTSFRRGDASISIVEGERLVFNSSNHTSMAWLVVQLDPKLEGFSTAWFEGRSGNIPLAWSITFFILVTLFVLFFIYHRFVLPTPSEDRSTLTRSGNLFLHEFWIIFKSFFQKENIGPALAFLLLFRLGESQIIKLAAPFLLDSRAVGGLGLTTGNVGLIFGTVGMVGLTLGGILGGLAAARKGLKYWLWPMVIAMNLPNLLYVYLAYVMPESLVLISVSVFLEQFGYGFGFTAYMLFMIYFSEGKHKTAHYAISTGIMALGMMLPGMISGWVQEVVGYQNFFIWVVLCTIPGFIVLKFLKINPAFGVRK